MKMRNKGKVHPSPSSSSSSSHSDGGFSVLKLLPAAILALVTVLSVEDKEVLAYMITRSLRSTKPPSPVNDKKKVNHKKTTSSSSSSFSNKPPAFDCDCFDCYTSYWFKWDNSPNRELIHQAIEAFEELGDRKANKKNNRGKKREKMSRRRDSLPLPAPVEDLPVIEESVVSNDDVKETAVAVAVAEDVAAAVVVRGGGGVSEAIDHKGFVRKVLPDVLGLFNSRLWNLWSPNA